MSGTPALIYVVEDELNLADAILFNLEAEGYRTEHTPNGRIAERRLTDPAADAPALVLMDVMLPDADGFAVVRKMRASGNRAPVLMLTARGRTEDVLEGFAAGADDYLAKPFELSILLARVQALVRRAAWPAVAVEGAADGASGVTLLAVPETVQLGERQIHFDSLTVDGPDGQIRLTLMEAELLHYLLARAGSAVSRKEILEEVWRVREDTDTRAIDNFIVRLRRYLEHDPAKPQYLLTVRGLGYRLVLPPG